MQNALGRFQKLAEQDLQAIVAEMQPQVVAVARAVISAGEYANFAVVTTYCSDKILRAPC
jgi:hypothetical protein